MNQLKKRIDWLDMAKGYGMIFVILAHLGIGVFGAWMYTFHIPLFFLLSGYVFSDKYDFKTFLMKKIKSMIIPYFCLGTPMIIFQSVRNWHNGTFSFHSFVNLIESFLIQRRMWTLWFLACLFFLNIFFYISKKILKTNFKLMVFAIFTTCTGLLYYKIVGIALPWNVDVCLMAYPFFFAGYFYKNNHDFIDQYLDNIKISILLFIGLGIINILCGYLTYRISGNGMEMYESTYGFPPLTFISAFAGITCVIIVSKWMTIKPVRYIGENSLLYFAWHQTIMMPLASYILSFVHFSADTIGGKIGLGVNIILSFIIIIILLTICNIIISNTKLRFMLGKK